GALVSYAASFIVSTLIQRFSQRLRNAIADKINKVPLKYFDSHAQGDTLSRVTNDVDLMTQSFNQSLVTMVASIVLLIGSIFMMIKTNGLLAVTAIGSVFAGFLLTGLI
ncbi:ABC transporter transmembrane domain-containing protein, partial [Streptococcus sobrinus]